MSAADEAGSALPSTRRRDGASHSWAESLVRWLDDGLRIPGTNIRFGLDPILGFLLPGVGDAATGVGAASLLFLALRERVPTVVLWRMVANIAVDALVGAFPLLGDLFDVYFKANRRNLELIERYRRGGQAEPGALDYAVTGLGLLLIVAAVAAPILIGAWIGVTLAGD